MGDNFSVKVQNIVHLLEDEQITNLYSVQYSKIEKNKKQKESIQTQIQALLEKTNSTDNYRNNLKEVENYYAQMKQQLNKALVIYDAQTNKINSEIEKLRYKKNEYQNSVNEYNLILSSVQKKLEQINQYINLFPKNRTLFSQQLDNINIQKQFLNLQINDLNKKISNIQSQLETLQNEKQVRLMKKENLQFYVNDMIEHPEKSVLSINLRKLNEDKEKLKILTKEIEGLDRHKLNVYFDAQKEFGQLYSNYLNGYFNNEEFSVKLKEYQQRLNNDKLLLENKPSFIEQLNDEINKLVSKMQTPVVEDEIIDIKPASPTLINKLKQKKKKIVAFCVSAFLVLGFGTSVKSFNNKQNDITNANQNVVSSQTLNNDLYIHNLNINYDDLQKEYFIPDTIKVQDGASIYDNSYDAIKDDNAMKPYYGYEQEKNVCGVTIQMPDGTIKTLYKTDKEFTNDYYKLINAGGIVKLYLTEYDSEYEGFYKADDSISTGMRR